MYVTKSECIGGEASGKWEMAAARIIHSSVAMDTRAGMYEWVKILLCLRLENDNNLNQFTGVGPN